MTGRRTTALIPVAIFIALAVSTVAIFSVSSLRSDAMGKSVVSDVFIFDQDFRPVAYRGGTAAVAAKPTAKTSAGNDDRVAVNPYADVD